DPMLLREADPGTASEAVHSIAVPVPQLCADIPATVILSLYREDAVAKCQQILRRARSIGDEALVGVDRDVGRMIENDELQTIEVRDFVHRLRELEHVFAVE